MTQEQIINKIAEEVASQLVFDEVIEFHHQSQAYGTVYCKLKQMKVSVLMPDQNTLEPETK